MCASRRAYFVALSLVGVALLAGGGGFLIGSATHNTEDGQIGSRIAECNSVKQLVVHQLIEGRVTLTQAIDRFAATNNTMPESSQNAIRVMYSGVTTPEGIGHQVISYVSSELADRPKRAEALVKRLEAELANINTSSSAVAVR